MSWILAIFTFNELLFYHTYCLKITDLRVPKKASLEAMLDCRYNLEGDQLYDVKWYKDNQQFFGCAPGKVNVYPLDGLSIHYDQYPSIGSCSFRLTNLNSKSEGEYKCEVSTEGPIFRTMSQYARLKFVPVSQILNESNAGGTVNITKNRIDSIVKKELNTTWNAYASIGTPLILNSLFSKETFIIYYFLLWILFYCVIKIV